MYEKIHINENLIFLLISITSFCVREKALGILPLIDMFKMGGIQVFHLFLIFQNPV